MSRRISHNLTLFSPSKVNVFLRITKKREDGYHELQSLFHAISLGDTLKFSISPSTKRDSLTTDSPGVPLDDKNLVIKAFNLFRKKTGLQTYFWVDLKKKVPTGAGLGGGSGNAATALWAANQLCGEVATVQELQEWSGEIGSDIPFFFSRGAAFCEGRGEIVEDLGIPIDLDTPLVLIKPPEECGTADVYRKFRLDAASKADPRELLARVKREGITQDTCTNDLEPPAFEVLPSLKALKQRVTAAGRGRYQAVFMSGSGSTIVAVGENPPDFLYEEPAYRDVFVSEARLIVREEGDWYRPPIAAGQAGLLTSTEDKSSLLQDAKGSGTGSLFDLKIPYSYES
eukprot:TRINITY_DN4384_c0_g2_i1.p1 TRINITY_DN4384_c0_g2~~TRINITY_DN4384_c0_g2_i1.p1  ORF type:complete len:378 (+),score=78.15 TRINITY_DN4384_c0_g2_i1:107-1135(+)